MNRTIDLPKQLRGAEVRAASFDEGDHTIDVVWTTGAKVRRRSWTDGPYDEELVVTSAAVRLDRLNAGAPFLNTHSDWSLEDVIGSVVPGTARLQGGEGLAAIKLSRAPSFADIVQNIRDGIIRNISVGYVIHQVEKIEADDGSVPTWRVVDWEPIEVSAVPVPADPGAQIRSASGSRTFPCDLRHAGSVQSASFRPSIQDGPGWCAPLRRWEA
jgi:hypothetical protein